MSKRMLYSLVLVIFIFSCDNNGKVNTARESGTLNILATTSIVADVITNITGDRAQVQMLLAPGINPHSFEATPRDLSKIVSADIIFKNGLGLEQFLDKMIKTANGRAIVVNLSQNIDALRRPVAENDHENHEEQGEYEHGLDDADPHVWTDPKNVIEWVKIATKKLTEADPQHGPVYEANARKYSEILQDLDRWIVEKVKQVPAKRRKLVTDHKVLGYFSTSYGFEQVGTIIPGYSALTEASARERAQLEDTIRSLNVKAVFVGNTVNPALAKQIAEDTGTAIVKIYTGSLGLPNSVADTYIKYCRYNTNVIVEALDN